MFVLILSIAITALLVVSVDAFCAIFESNHPA